MAETNSTPKITPYLWFADQAEEAANLYVSAFAAAGSGAAADASRILRMAHYGEAGAQATGTAAGSVMTVEFQLAGQTFIGLNGGPVFKFNPAISLFVSCDTSDEVDQFWATLSEGGEVLMPLDRYPFSERFGWLNDRYGVSWQFNLAPTSQKIRPCLMFTGEQHGKAEEAMNFYTSLFENSSIMVVERRGADAGEAEGTVMHARFSLEGEEFIAMDGGREHAFTFNEAISFLVNCQTQEEVDGFWHKFTEEGEEGACGWVKDKYGVSWQIVPTVLPELLMDSDADRAERVMQAMLKMKKIDIQGLRQAYAAQ